MLCNLTKVHLIRYSFFALVLSCCLSLFGFVSDSHATDIVSEHYVSNSGPVAFCGSLVTLHASSDRNCSDYSFLFILPISYDFFS